MSYISKPSAELCVTTFDEFVRLADYSLMDTLNADPKYTWREWLIVPAYQKAMQGYYTLVRELQEVLSYPYDEQSQEIEDKYYRLKPRAFFNVDGVSHYSCSS